jgi:4-amino-4-deoxy-L-arabinose transferase-like glycosyltransferase
VARILQAVIAGILQPYLAYRLGSRMFSRPAGLVAAALTAGYAYFVYYSAALMTEAFFFCAVLATLDLAAQLIPPAEPSRRRSAGQVWWLATGLGLSAGVAVLLRQVFLLYLPVLFFCVWWLSVRRGQGGLSLARLTLAGGLVVGMMLPFTAYNYSRFRQLVLLNTNAGFAFYWANHPTYGTRFDPIITTEAVNYRTLLPDELHGLNEAELDRELLKRGIGFILADPIRYLRLSASRIPIFFMFWPSSESSLVSNLSRVGSFGVLWPFMLYGVILAGLGAIKRQPGAGSTMVLLLVFALVYTLIHVLSWTLVRYRLSIDAVLVIFSAAGLLDLFSRVRPRTAGVKVVPT